MHECFGRHVIWLNSYFLLLLLGFLTVDILSSANCSLKEASLSRPRPASTMTYELALGHDR